MDSDIALWILESVARDKTVSDTTLNYLINILPIPTNNFSLNKSLLLRRIVSEIDTNVGYENVLDLLEMAEELDHGAGVESSNLIKRAYREVAVEYTVKAMDEAAEFFLVVKRVWRGRVSRMGDCGLVSDELMGWMDDVEAAVWDENAREKVKKIVTEIDAVGSVKAYLAEAWEELGPTFLDVVAELVESDETVKEALGLGERVEEYRAPELRNTDVVAEMNDDITREVSGLGNDQVHQHRIINDADNAEINDDTVREVSGLGDSQVLHQHLIIDDANNVSQNGTRMPRRKHVAKKRPRGSIAGTSRGAKISDTEQVDNEELLKNYGCLPSPAIEKVQEALKASSSELHAVVTDPLPEALKLAENAMSKNKDKRNPEVVANESDPKEPCISNENNVPRPSLMTRNTSARTYEWNDSIDDLPAGDTSSGSRIKLPSPKNRVVSPLKKHEMKNLTRRRKVKWSTLEEETLRAGVEKYGRGCWKAILTAYHDVFESRTDVDLKDKWRNMTRYSD